MNVDDNEMNLRWRSDFMKTVEEMIVLLDIVG